MNNLKFAIITFTLLFFFSNQVFASHIIGGEMNYRCLGSDQYEITLTIYRDCDNGNPGAWFDNPAPIGVFDAQSHSLINTVMFSLDQSTSDTLIDGPNACIGNLCLEKHTYTDTLILPNNNNGYILTYQRCCRSIVLGNLIDPNTTGMTISIEITVAALLACNNSPIFNFDFPIVLGINDTLSFNLSANDSEGDSLAYTFFTPFRGGSSQNSIPNPPTSPPYLPVSYLPPYTLQLPIPSNINTSYNSITGEFLISPTTIGAYVMGFSILEYNNAGVLLSQTYKDYTLNVGYCSINLNTKNIPTDFITSIFPNPSNNFVNIEVEDNESIQLGLYSSIGQKLLKTSFFRQIELNLSSFPKGIYYIKLFSKKKNNLVVKKIVKK